MTPTSDDALARRHDGETGAGGRDEKRDRHRDDASRRDGGDDRVSGPEGNPAQRKPAGAAARAAPDPFIRRMFAVAALLVAALLLWSWRHALLLALVSVLIALALLGIRGWISKITRLGPKISLGLAALLLVGSLAGIATLFGAQISGQVTELADRLPGAVQEFRGRLLADPLGARVVTEIERIANGGGGGSPLQSLAAQAGGVAMGIGNGFLEAILVIVAAIYFAIDPEPYRRGIALLVPRRRREDVRTAMDATGVALQKWMGGTLLSMCIIATLVTTGLYILGVPAPIALGLLAGLSQLVPVVGPIISAAPGVLLALTVSPEIALWALVVYLVASQLEANVVTPLVQKRAVSLPPAVTIFAIASMGILFGPLGIVLAPPLAIILIVIVTQFYVRSVLGEDEPLPGEA